MTAHKFFVRTGCSFFLAYFPAFFSTLFPSLAQAAKIEVFAAASLTDVLPPIAADWLKKHPHDPIEFNFDGSSRLAKQIESGAHADIFFSADSDWMQNLERKRYVDAKASEDLLGNEMVWIVPRDATAPENLRAATDGLSGTVALASENVPIALYAKAALEEHAGWSKIAPHLVRGDNVRSSLLWVADHHAVAGIVYLTDALADKRVKVAFKIAPAASQKIVYPVAPLKTAAARAEVRDFLSFLKANSSRETFTQAGFKVLSR